MIATFDTGIEVYGDCLTPSVEPAQIVLTCADGNTVLEDLHWTTWTATSATAVRTLSYNDCTPYCAAGHLHYLHGVRVMLTDPVKDPRGQLVRSRSRMGPEPPGWSSGPHPLPTRPS